MKGSRLDKNQILALRILDAVMPYILIPELETHGHLYSLEVSGDITVDANHPRFPTIKLIGEFSRDAYLSAVCQFSESLDVNFDRKLFDADLGISRYNIAVIVAYNGQIFTASFSCEQDENGVIVVVEDKAT